MNGLATYLKLLTTIIVLWCFQYNSI